VASSSAQSVNACRSLESWPVGTGFVEGTVLGRSRYKVTPASGKNIYNNSDPRNTWNGPIVKDETGEHRYHAYVPLYKPGSLGGPPSILHGVANNITGPWVSIRPTNRNSSTSRVVV
jgi:hypothetical protein